MNAELRRSAVLSLTIQAQVWGSNRALRTELYQRAEIHLRPGAAPHVTAATLAAAVCGALVSECDKAIPGEVQTRSRTSVAGVILTQVTLQSFTTHERAPAASLRSRAGGTGAVLGGEGAVVRDGEVGRALLMRR